jgi:hypothetical protein
MPARSNFNSNAIRRKADAAIARGVLNVMLRLQNELLVTLSQRGTGRIYSISKSGDKRAQGLFEPGSMEGMTKDMRLGIGPITPEQSRQLVRNRANIARYRGFRADAATIDALMTKKRGGRFRNLRAAGFHQASAIGRPPAPDTGNLRKTTQGRNRLTRLTRSTKVGYRLSVGANYAKPLEYGTRKMGPRPFVRPSLDKIRPIGPGVIANSLRLAGFRIKR